MKKLLLVLFLNVLLTPVAYAAPVYPISTPRLGEATENKTAKEKHHLIGPVQTVITEQTEFSRKDEKWVEGPRKRPSRMTFDVRGNFTELAEYNVEGSVLKSDKYSYSYDANGNVTEEVYHHADGSLGYRIVRSYDLSGRTTASSNYGADGSLSERSVMTYDAKGNMIESIRYDGAGSVEEAWQYTHEFDPVGNWIRQVQSQAITEADGVRFVPTSVYYRTITYYPETKKPAAEKAEPPKSKQ